MNKTKTCTDSNSDISYTVELVSFDDNRHRVYLSKNPTIGCERTNVDTLIDWATKNIKLLLSQMALSYNSLKINIAGNRHI